MLEHNADLAPEPVEVGAARMHLGAVDQDAAALDRLELSADGMTMIVVTHEMSFAREVSNRVAFFHQGKIHEIGAPRELFEEPRHPETAAFLKSIL